MRRLILPEVLLVIAVVVGFVAQAALLPANYVYEKSYVCPNHIQAEFIPANTSVTGYIRAEHPFSAYVIISDSGYFGEFDPSSAVMMWENVTAVELDFQAPGEDCYLVIKNGNTSQIVEIEFKAEH
ncbi:multidrug transporter [Thermococcus piezophilus]|uniref:Multidrug transporter n=1 Tax=Thermococcus piezophilus TaxID=1712654 RepID=A0A172WHB6_9EURY|nr:multidrug transporter [Thermococcus piezophilus]ANF22715.1 multidrug transporter [Thermococcus piezophilus]